MSGHLITNAEPRSQNARGKFAPHYDTDNKAYGVMYAAVGGSNRSHFPHIGEAVNNGMPFGQHGQHRLKWDEFKDRKGNPHDVTLSDGTVVRQLVCPRQDLDAKTQMEAQDSTEMLGNALSEEQKLARSRADQFSARTVEELTFGQENIMRQPTEHEQMPSASSTKVGWTPERRARQAATLAAKKTQPK